MYVNVYTGKSQAAAERVLLKWIRLPMSLRYAKCQKQPYIYTKRRIKENYYLFIIPQLPRMDRPCAEKRPANVKTDEIRDPRL